MLRNAYDLFILAAVVIMASVGVFPIVGSLLGPGGVGGGTPPGGPTPTPTATPAPPTTPAADTTLRLIPASGQIPAATQTAVDLELDTAIHDAYGFEIYLNFDVTALEVVQVQRGTLPPGWTWQQSDVASGQVRLIAFAGADPGAQPLQGVRTLATLQLRGLSSTAATSITYGPLTTVAGLATSLSYQGIEGQYTVP